jgi:hypothetical protein
MSVGILYYTHGIRKTFGSDACVLSAQQGQIAEKNGRVSPETSGSLAAIHQRVPVETPEEIETSQSGKNEGMEKKESRKGEGAILSLESSQRWCFDKAGALPVMRLQDQNLRPPR